MKLFTILVFTVAFSTYGNAAVAGEGSPQGDSSGALAGRIFLVEVEILSSPFFPEYEGAIFPTCFTFQEDGTWIDLEWPGEGAEPIPGVWIEHTGFPHVSFTATAKEPSLGWTLVEYGVAGPSQGRGNLKMSTYAMVFGEANELFFYIQGKGHAVETCPL
jgi:hypothetical protein